uniref:Uncharacterized protein n=1 Tax=Peronospora matthiolae TaxID=2874970 RepID=A0AAV1TBJ2_9STRA
MKVEKIDEEVEKIDEEVEEIDEEVEEIDEEVEEIDEEVEEIDDEVDEHSPALPIDPNEQGPDQYLHTKRTFIPALVLLLVGLVVLGCVAETQLMVGAPLPVELNVSTGDWCMPEVSNISEIEYHSGHRFYSALKDMSPLEAPTFRGSHRVLCGQEMQWKQDYTYCLPISGSVDTPFCTAADRTDLLNVRTPESLCYASVLHMLLVDVYDELLATGNIPLILYGSLLGAVRNGSVIPYTEDIDIGYVNKFRATRQVQKALRKKGYHMFDYYIWRVCVAPTHPLASRLYDPSLPLTTEYSVPYLDLYRVKNGTRGYYDVAMLEGSHGSLLARKKVEPFSQVMINGMPFDTVHDPHFFLTEAYGPDYMTPIQRTKPSLLPETSSSSSET